MRILDDVKLDFKDVLFVPKRSTLRSRSDVDLNRNYVFKHSQQAFSGVPIMASNMDGVGTFEMAMVLQSFPLFTCLVKSYGLSDWNTNKDFDENYTAISTGIGSETQKPLAIVVIGGLITSTILTLLILPIIYSIVHTVIHERKNMKVLKKIGAA